MLYLRKKFKIRHITLQVYQYLVIFLQINLSKWVEFFTSYNSFTSPESIGFTRGEIEEHFYHTDT